MKKILVIDDEEMLRSTFRAYLEDYDYEVITAGDGAEGLEIFHTEKPDVLLVDLNMPRIDGFGVLKVVHEKSPDTPIIVISGIGIVNDAIRAIRLGAWDYLTKPIVDLDILAHTLEKAFERERLIRENREYKRELEEKVKRRTLQLQYANRSLQRTQQEIVRVLGRAGEYRDNETGKHVIRVSKYCKMMAQMIGLSETQIDLIERTSPLHDIGKIGIPDSILLKPGPLDREEWEIMQKHCEYGFHILSASRSATYDALDHEKNTEEAEALLKMARKIALYHHEKWDGSGYPNGLKEDEIPIEARITAIADIYDALGSDRSYKKAFAEEKCQSIVRDLSGSHLDPSIVAAFFQSIDEILSIKHEWKD